MVLRSKIMLMADKSLRNQAIADDLGVHVQTPRRWRKRWAESAERLAVADGKMTDKELRLLIEDVLSDQPRSGTPATFTAEQICQIVAISCEPPEEAGRPGSGPWQIYPTENGQTGESPFSLYRVNQTPEGATQICVLVANADHSVQQNTGNCFDLP